MKLYYAPDTCSLAVWISLEWLGANYELEKANLGSEEYKKINPLGSVPALETEGGKIKTELGAIITFLAEKYPEMNLGPDDSIEDRFLFNQLILLISSDLHPSFGPIFAPKRYTLDTDEESLDKIRKAAYPRIDSILSYIDTLLGDRDHIYKDKKTVLDAYLFILSGWAEFTLKSWTEYPNIKRFREKLLKDEKVKYVLENQK